MDRYRLQQPFALSSQAHRVPRATGAVILVSAGEDARITAAPSSSSPGPAFTTAAMPCCARSRRKVCRTVRAASTSISSRSGTHHDVRIAGTGERQLRGQIVHCSSGTCIGKCMPTGVVPGAHSETGIQLVIVPPARSHAFRVEPRRSRLAAPSCGQNRDAAAHPIARPATQICTAPENPPRMHSVPGAGDGRSRSARRPSGESGITRSMPATI